jgi:serine/threonine protein kinase
MLVIFIGQEIKKWIFGIYLKQNIYKYYFNKKIKIKIKIKMNSLNETNENKNKKILFQTSKNILKNIINNYLHSHNILNEIKNKSRYEISFITHNNKYYVKKKIKQILNLDNRGTLLNHISKKGANGVTPLNLIKEINILKIFKNSNDKKYLDYFPKIILKISTDFQMVTEFGGIDLFTLTNDFDFFNYEKIIEFKYIFKQVILALNFLHSLNLTHGDVKPANILVNDNLKITLIDYDLSFYDTLDKINKKFGTHEYLSPEIYNCGIITNKTDTWSLGTTMYCCYKKKNLYKYKINYVIQKHYIDVMTDVNYLENYIKNLKMEKEFEELIINFMKYEPNDRVELTNSIKYSFFNSLEYKYLC